MWMYVSVWEYVHMWVQYRQRQEGGIATEDRAIGHFEPPKVGAGK